MAQAVLLPRPQFFHLIPAVRVSHFPIIDWIRRIHYELQSKGSHYVLAVRTYVQNILLEAVRQLPDDCVTAKSDKPVLKFERLEAVFKFIDQHLSEDLSAQQVCRVAHMSRAYFHRFFKKATNMTLTEYVQRRRTDWARDLLLHTDLPVTQIALRVGFGSPSYFGRGISSPGGVNPLTISSSVILGRLSCCKSVLSFLVMLPTESRRHSSDRRRHSADSDESTIVS